MIVVLTYICAGVALALGVASALITRRTNQRLDRLELRRLERESRRTEDAGCS